MNEHHTLATTEKSERIATLIMHYKRGSLSIHEHDELDDWIACSDANMLLFEELTDKDALQEALNWMKEINYSRILRLLKKQLQFAGIRQWGSLLV